jgi:hypothetical protein
LAGEPLVVVVEASANSGVTPEEVRVAVAKEIAGVVADPSDSTDDGNSETLLIAIKEVEAVLSFRAREGALRRRSIALPEDHQDRVRTLAWVSMNLVKDQVAGLLGDVTDEDAKAPALVPPPTKTEATTPAEVKPPVPATESTVATQLHEPSQSPSSWSLSAFAGPSMHLIGSGIDTNQLTWSPWRKDGLEYQLEAQRPLWDWTVGVALDMGAADQPVVALAAFIGDGWQRGRLRLDATVGLGLELTDRRVLKQTQVSSSATGMYTSTEISTGLRPRLYGRGNLTLLWTFGRSVALTLRAALHLATDDLYYCYGSALLGVRMNLP